MRNLKKPVLGKLSIITFAIMNVVAVVSLRGLPSEAEYGLREAAFKKIPFLGV